VPDRLGVLDEGSDRGTRRRQQELLDREDRAAELPEKEEQGDGDPRREGEAGMIAHVADGPG